jgi:hypothetical protein
LTTDGVPHYARPLYVIGIPAFDLHQPLKGAGGVHRLHILALDVLDERLDKRRVVFHLLDLGGDVLKPGAAGGFHAPVAVDQLEERADGVTFAVLFLVRVRPFDALNEVETGTASPVVAGIAVVVLITSV